MGKRHVRAMLRKMSSGERVAIARSAGSIGSLARLASVAEQFGYAYAGAGLGGFKSEQLMLELVPDPGPEAQARAERNRALYPNAGDGVSLPPLVREEVELLKARISFDFASQYTAKQRLALGLPVATVLAAAPCIRFGPHSTATLVAVILWAVFMLLVPVGLASVRRARARYGAQLAAAGFTPVTDELGRLRYVSPGGPLPRRGNPVA
ncbi:hypothetical protein GCM10018793_46960 [Streptomyces sulfonofaciens]|uniref:Integral membrane protein n=1 Tax=Streptomyces sulfonofaciens TaxID=68272 RepID=A0A919GFR5_9ACTN|nr:hypothetical protein [Streptomyces sulfonofaciens]GHH83858.1 hypothetical protein GCM10018793_46960 [Streptomyces sulfonofaciens]